MAKRISKVKWWVKANNKTLWKTKIISKNINKKAVLMNRMEQKGNGNGRSKNRE